MKSGQFAPCVAMVIAVLTGLGAHAWGQPTFAKAATYTPTDEERVQIETQARSLAEAIARLPKTVNHDLLADVRVYHKAAERALALGEFFDKKDVATTLGVLKRGLERAEQLGAGKPSWSATPGSFGRGFVSRVDGSVQPYAVIVPEGLEIDNDHRARLDVVLHGRNQTISEARFLSQFDGKPAPKGSEGKVTLHVFGRGNNAYRWAGETDVFEAIAAVKRNYKIDDAKVVLRGFSMGGAGAWHLGLHHPSVWSSVEAGAGFTETKKYAKLKDTPEYQEKALHIYDSTDYALNAFDVPMVGYGGEEDPQLQASLNIVEELKSLKFGMKTEGLLTRGEGLDFLWVIGAKMGHKVDPESAKILAAFHDDHINGPSPYDRKRIRFATYTLKYNRVGWLSIERLFKHYDRAEIDAEIDGDRVVVRKAANVAVLGVDRHVAESIVLGDQTFPLEGAVKGLLPYVYFRSDGEGAWRQLDYMESRAIEENADHAKRPGLQGPIDDAFTGPFLCVRGTGNTWSKAAGRWTTARLDQFRDDWNVWMRGAAPIKNDSDLTPEDIENHNLILFGDPSSNGLIERVLKSLPMIQWTRDAITIQGETFTGADHVPVLIAPNPLNPHRYVVINSGHTFGAKEFAGTNALLFPRLGDFAVFQTDGRNSVVKVSGYFDEGWSMRAK